MGDSLRLKVTVVHPVDPLGSKIGGIPTFIKNFIKYAPEDFDVEVAGISSSPEERKVGEWQELSIQGREFMFLPVLGVEDENLKTRVPLTLRFTLSLVKHINKLDLEKGIVEFHRIEPSTLFSKKKGKKVLFVHGHMGDLFNVHSEIRWSRIPQMYFGLEKALMTQFSRVYVVRRDGVEFYRDRYPLMGKKFYFLPTWVDEELFYPYAPETRRAERRRFFECKGYEPEAKLVLFVGRLEGQKNPLLMIDSFRQLYQLDRRARLLIVGDGMLRDEVKERADKYGISHRVEFINPLPQNKLAHFMRISDALILTSAFEGMPRSVLEALACGLPVVTTDVGEVRRVVRSGVSGVVCWEPTPQAIAIALAEVLRGSVRPEGCISSVRDYRAQQVLEGVYDFYRRLGGME